MARKYPQATHQFGTPSRSTTGDPPLPQTGRAVPRATKVQAWARTSAGDSSQLSALLGPTNTGKTHRAVERMLEHRNGMIGLPLRLLAREVYDKISSRLGERQVALVTGEEKRVPRRPRYWVCTVEAMPVEREVDFVAIDEIQLAGHSQRGHVFTDRLLHARGREETWFMGAESMRPLIQELAPTAAFRRFPRLSRLHAVGALGLAALPPRTAVIAFSASEVYELADKLRHRRGGAAVVLGALSPRTRNAQVAMYQAGEVDFLVATDAIGMGLNMDVDHIAFAALHKFDGIRRRALIPAELAQIAGRAGRHTRDGSFGTLTPLALPPPVTFAIESHRFAPLRHAVWRNSELEFDSVDALVECLQRRPPRKLLQLVDSAADEAALKLLRDRPLVRQWLRGPEDVKRLWEVCRIPDFRKLLVEHHANLLMEIFVQLSQPRGQLKPSYLDEQISRLENANGDIDSLMMRLEFIRTWSYIAHRADWVAEPEHWQQRTQQAEDALSEALHQRLIERFVQRRSRGRRSSGKPNRPRRAARAVVPLTPADPSHPFSQLQHMRATLEKQRAASEVTVDDWAEALIDAPHEALTLTAEATIVYDDEVVARLTRGQDRRHPEVRLSLPQEVGGGSHSRLLRRLRAFARDVIDEWLGPLREHDHNLKGPARGVIYQLEKGLGTIARRQAVQELKQLTEAAHTLLVDAGVVFGQRYVYLNAALTAAAVEARIGLCNARLNGITIPSAGGALSLPRSLEIADEHYLACGFVPLSTRIVRVDVGERAAEELQLRAKGGAFPLPEEMAAALDCPLDELPRLVIAFGYAETREGFVRV